jgi:hypothetical protein
MAMILLFGPAFGLAWKAKREHMKLSPLGDRIVTASSLAVPLIPAVAVMGLLLRGSRERRTSRAALMAGLVLLGGVGLLAVLYNQYELIFADSLLARSTSPDGRRVALLYKWGLFCGHDLYVGGANDLLLPKVEDPAGGGGCEDTLRLEWAGAEVPKVVR